VVVSYCSNCLKKAKHRLVKDPLIGKDVYECSKCGHRAYKCSICDNLAIEDENNREGLFCAEHFGTIGAFDRVDDRIDDISDFRKLFVDDNESRIERIVKAYNRVDDFDIVKIKDGIEPYVIVIDGFLNQKNRSFDEWRVALEKLYPNNGWYKVSWESKLLRDIAAPISVAVSEWAFIRRIFKLFIPYRNIFLIFSGYKGLIEPWLEAVKKAKQTGYLLAFLISRTNREYILCGHSLGARVIFYTLQKLAKSDRVYIDSVHLLGGAINNRSSKWRKAMWAVKRKIYNYYSKNDIVLKILFSIGTVFKEKAIGRNEILKVKGVENIDVTPWVKGHSRYKEFFEKFGKIS